MIYTARAISTISWLLIGTTLLTAACGDRTENHKSTIRKGTAGTTNALEKFDSKLAPSSEILSGYWMQAPEIDSQNVTRTLYWEISKDRKNLIIRQLCEPKDKNPKTAQANSKIKTNLNELLIQSEIEKTESLEGDDGSNIPCQVQEEKALLRYTVNEKSLEILDEKNQPIREFRRADLIRNRPVAREPLAPKVDPSLPQEVAPEVEDAPDLSGMTDEEKNVAIESEGEMAKEVKNVMWQTPLGISVDIKNKKEISSYLSLKMTTYNEKDILLISKVCYYSEDLEGTRSEAKDTPDVMLTGKGIRTSKEILKTTKATETKPGCDLKVSTKPMSYSYDEATKQLFIKSERGLEKYQIAVKKKSADSTK